MLGGAKGAIVSWSIVFRKPVAEVVRKSLLHLRVPEIGISSRRQIHCRSREFPRSKRRAVHKQLLR